MLTAATYHSAGSLTQLLFLIALLSTVSFTVGHAVAALLPGRRSGDEPRG